MDIFFIINFFVIVPFAILGLLFLLMEIIFDVVERISDDR